MPIPKIRSFDDSLFMRLVTQDGVGRLNIFTR
jgi:hypothetical protein